MDCLLSELAARHILITLIAGSDLGVVAPDEEWDRGLADYLSRHKPQIVSELLQRGILLPPGSSFPDSEPEKLATAATLATIGINSADPIATSLLQVATGHHTGHSTNSHREGQVPAQDDRPTDQIASGTFLDRAAWSGTIKELKSLLKGFGHGHWNILERAAMSSLYTPIALKLIATENLERHRTLEDLSALCWGKGNEVSHGDVASSEISLAATTLAGEVQNALEGAKEDAGKTAATGDRTNLAIRDDELMSLYIDRFINCTKVWAKQWVSYDKTRDGYAYQKPDMDTNGGKFVYEPVTANLVNRHFLGEITCGWAAIDSCHCSKWLCFDSDTDDGALDELEAFLRKYNWQVIREGRRSGRDGHMWLFFDKPVAVERLIALGTAMMRGAKVSGLELFPKSPTGLSQVRGPLGINQKPDAQGARGWFDGVAQDVRAQLKWLAAQPLNLAEDAINVANWQHPVPQAMVKPAASNGARTSGNKYPRLHILAHVSARRSGKEYIAQCPVCGSLGLDTHRNNLHISEDGERFCCWYGGQPGKIHTARDIIKALVASTSGAP